MVDERREGRGGFGMISDDSYCVCGHHRITHNRDRDLVCHIEGCECKKFIN